MKVTGVIRLIRAASSLRTTSHFDCTQVNLAEEKVV